MRGASDIAVHARRRARPREGGRCGCRPCPSAPVTACRRRPRGGARRTDPCSTWSCHRGHVGAACCATTSAAREPPSTESSTVSASAELTAFPRQPTTGRQAPTGPRRAWQRPAMSWVYSCLPLDPVTHPVSQLSGYFCSRWWMRLNVVAGAPAPVCSTETQMSSSVSVTLTRQLAFLPPWPRAAPRSRCRTGHGLAVQEC